MKPYVICHMLGSIDGRLHPSRFTASFDGDKRNWSAAYEALHDALAGDAWMVGRITMAEMSKAEAHPPAEVGAVTRPVHVARQARSHAVALDPSGKLHFAGDAVGGDHVIVLLGHDVTDSHLAELAADGVSYIVADNETMDLAAMLATLGARFGIRRLMLEGGGTINGSLIAAGLVDELSVLIAPALDGDRHGDGIVMHDGSLTGTVRIGLLGASTLADGLVHLRYRVEPATPSAVN
ncbi:riboflavin biosynthesis pyrimidine reductase [Sphingomonas zeicaulis]|uniref:dihydrofolate reductase family protein n=1 Tax=Sphingomonas zeicaulis TaxID=1632740 RepID=UPI003D1A6228